MPNIGQPDGKKGECSMARLRQYLSCLNLWEEVAAAVEEHAAELPHMEMVRPELLSLLEQAQSLVVEMNEHTSGKQEAKQFLLRVLRTGKALVDVMQTAARQRFGNDSEKLVKFRVQPLRGRPRKQPPVAPNPEAPTPTPTPE
jgi:hypothetical protein